MLPVMLDLESLRALYAAGTLTPRDMAETVAARMARSEDPAIFITPVDREGLLVQVEALLARAPAANSLPMWGIPFAVKDNIDVAGLPTTAACPAFAYTPHEDAVVVARLKEAGAIVIGKTNLDQFATGLNGTRSPYGAPRCVFDKDHISGGSSSGSGVAVAAGLACFSLGTDTAGSGRVPAALNNIVGIKPTPGRVSTTGLVPACRTLDVITVFAGCVADGVAIRRIAEGYDPRDAFSSVPPLLEAVTHPRVGVLKPEDREFYGDHAAAALYEAAIAKLADLGASVVPFDYAPFLETAKLLYEGPWVAERLAGLKDFVVTNSGDFDPSVRAIVEGANRFSAVAAFEGLYRLNALKRKAARTWADVDMLLLPTAPTTYRVDAMQADPIRLNSHLGQYTNFANLMGLAAIAVPAGFKPDGLPFGVTLVGLGASDDALAPLAHTLHAAAACGMGLEVSRALPTYAAPTAEARIPLVVVGAHLSGMALNPDLVGLGARLDRALRTTPDYRLYALPGTVPPKPGLVRVADGGAAIEVEVWSLAPAAFARFVEAIPQPLGIGRIALEDGSAPQGFLCEAYAVTGARDISAFGGWRAFRRDGAA